MSALFDEDCSYVNEDDIHSFAKALVWDDDDYLSTSSSPSLPKYSEVKQEAEAMDSLNLEKPTLIALASDWFPITGSKPKKKESLSTRDRFTNEFRHLSSYKLLR